MLFFILGWFVLASLLIKFKYISCYSLSLRRRLLVHVSLIQIHLMLFFICIFYCIYSVLSCIQIHLMLFFIPLEEDVFVFVSHSNTSHVILYQKYFRTEHILRRIQIHLMLFFIKTSLMYHLCGMQFKYISCYSLSSFIFLPAPSYSAFKYISCYSLSRQKEGNHGRGDIQIHLMLFFIPLYRQASAVQGHIQIHLMLFFILFHFFLIPSYTPIQIHLMLFFIDILQAIYKRRNLIQIHLMLFFIYMHNYCIDLLWYSNTSHVILYLNIRKFLLFLSQFKYISCYSLSKVGAIHKRGV